MSPETIRRFRNVFAAQNVGIKEVREKIWLVTFMNYDLRFFDEESGRVDCAENPFSAKQLHWLLSRVRSGATPGCCQELRQPL